MDAVEEGQTFGLEFGGSQFHMTSLSDQLSQVESGVVVQGERAPLEPLYNPFLRTMEQKPVVADPAGGGAR